MKKIVGSRELIRNINEKNIIKEIFEKKETDRTSISKKVSLSGATVTKIVNEMISKDILVEKGETDSTGGRRPILLSLNKNYGEFIAFKIGMGYINNLITDFSGEKLYRETFYFEKITEEIIIKHITESLKNEKIKNPISVGIGISGIVNTKEGCVVNSYILNLNNFYLGKIIKEETGIDTYIFNDVDSFSMTHYWEGNIKKYKNSVVMTLGVGIGGSIFVNSEAYNGIGVGEIGHMVIKENGEKCTCGDNGCLEAEATFKNIVEMIKKETESEKLINKYKELKDTEFSEREFIRLAREEDYKNYKKAFKEYSYLIGIAVKNLINILSPEYFLIGGEALEFKDDFLENTINYAVEKSFGKIGRNIVFDTDKLGEDAWTMGVIYKMFDEKIFNLNM